jgi:hypothetical protein
MKNSFVLLLCALAFCVSFSHAAADKTLISARVNLLHPLETSLKI